MLHTVGSLSGNGNCKRLPIPLNLSVKQKPSSMHQIFINYGRKRILQEEKRNLQEGGNERCVRSNVIQR